MTDRPNARDVQKPRALPTDRLRGNAHDQDDAPAVIADFGWTRVHRVGMSLGGIIAAHYAARAGAQAASLTLIDVAPNVDFDAIGPMRHFVDRPIPDLSLDQLVDAAIAVGARGGRDRILAAP